MSTKGILIERLMRLVNAGRPETNQRATREHITRELESALSSVFKTQVFDTNFNFDGDSVPDGLLIATYENIPVTRRDNGRCQAQLPVAPMVLPKGIGVFSVYPAGYPEQEYIPLRTGFINLLNTDALLNPLAKKTYSVHGSSVMIHADIVGEGVTMLDMQLCVLDISHYGDYDPLPVPADMEEEAIRKVLEVFGVMSTTDKKDNKAPSPQKSDA